MICVNNTTIVQNINLVFPGKIDGKMSFVAYRHSGHVHIIPYSFSRRCIILYGTMSTDAFCGNGEYDFTNIQTH